MTGLVLCGGESKRMGSDKGLLIHGGTRWAEIAVCNLSALEIPVSISVNRMQFESYLKLFRTNEMIVDDEYLPVKGPLLGLLSVHQQIPGEDLLVIACDMLHMRKPVLETLVKVYKEQSFEAYAFTTRQRIQPLCAIYTSRGLEKMLDVCLRGQLKRYSMMYVLECLYTKYISADDRAGCFENFNSAEDLSKT